MTTELWLLFWSLPLYGLYLGAQSLIFRWRFGITYAASARDEELPEGELLGRAERALKNFQETWPVFISLALIAHLALPGDPLIFWGAVVWYAARIAYLPLYLWGVFMIRSLVWNVSLIGLLMMGWAVLF
jgi:uncharacterized MAPEG superfamily protein